MHTFLGNNSAIGACLALGAAIGERDFVSRRKAALCRTVFKAHHLSSSGHLSLRDINKARALPRRVAKTHRKPKRENTHRPSTANEQ
jgi:hypothetical protein